MCPSSSSQSYCLMLISATPSSRRDNSVRIVQERRFRVVADVSNGSFRLCALSIAVVQALGGGLSGTHRIGHAAIRGFKRG